MGFINSLPDGGGSSGGLAGPPGPQGPKGAQGPKGDPGTGFKLASDGNFDIEKRNLLNLEVLPDAKIDDSLAITRKDFYSGVNKGYVNENFLKKDGFNFNLKGSNITNGEPYYDGLYGDRDRVSKRYVDIQNDKQDIAINDKLSKDGTSQMEGALDMNNNKIVNVGDTTEQDGDAINYRYFNREKGVLTGLINNASAQAVQRDGSVPMTGNLNMDSNKITNLNTDATDLDSAANVRHVSTSNAKLLLSLTQSLDKKIKDKRVTHHRKAKTTSSLMASKTFPIRPTMSIKRFTFLEWERGVKTDIHPDLV